MGCGAYSPTNGTRSEIPPTIYSEEVSDKKIEHILSVGDKALGFDVFQSKYSGETISKWRLGTVLTVSPQNLITLGFDGWNATHNLTIDLTNPEQSKKICPVNLLSIQQKDDGTPLSRAQLEKSKLYFTTGKMEIPLEKVNGRRKSTIRRKSFETQPPAAITSPVQQETLKSRSCVQTELDSPSDEEEEETPPRRFEKKKETPSWHRRRSSFSDSKIVPSRSVQPEYMFFDRMADGGLHIAEVDADGNCLFRAISHQLFMNEDHHMEIRLKCVAHIEKHRRRFESFCSVNFDDHIKRMRRIGTWGDDLEIKALEEIYDRIICIYSTDSHSAVPVPIASNFNEQALLGRDVPPMKLSYHGSCHYNSVFDEKFPLPLPPRQSEVLLRTRMRLFPTPSKKKALSNVP